MRKLMLMIVLGGVLAGCGGDSESEAEREAEEASGRGTVTCEGSATSDEIGLPAGFPELEGVIWVESELNGPTRIVDGYAEKGLEELYDGYKSGLEDAGFSILFDEIEEDDAEVSYEEQGEASDGIIALRSCDEDTTSIHVTNRPK
jgi:hypothetical protein